MATSRRTGMPVITETIAVAMATPAEGPSFGVAPSGTCTWMSRWSNKGGLMPKATARVGRCSAGFQSSLCQRRVNHDRHRLSRSFARVRNGSKT
jgi:hypothetical protein